MTMTEVAELTGLSRTNVYKARKEGRLEAHRTAPPGSYWLVRRTDAYRFHLDRELRLHPGLYRVPKRRPRRKRSLSRTVAE